MNLYEIDAAIMECCDFETGEIIDIERLDELEMARDTKIENICLWIKNLTAEAEALKAEKLAFEARQKVTNNKLENLKKYITQYLAGAKFSTPKVAVSFRKSESLEIKPGAMIPDEYMKYKPEVNKTDLKIAVKAGLKIEGVQIVTNQNIQIK
ncbi:MAG: siphovirus Gp157 family protein [Lachnospiraceae bacterium]|nr:siphovirus Gp157 family protein [Lachnospiraceae bacterium]